MRKTHTNCCEFRVQSRPCDHEHQNTGLTKPVTSQYVRYSVVRSQRVHTPLRAPGERTTCELLGNVKLVVTKGEQAAGFKVSELERITQPKLRMAFTEHHYTLVSEGNFNKQVETSFGKLVSRVANELKKSLSESQKASCLLQQNKSLQKQLQQRQRPLSKKPTLTSTTITSLQTQNLKLLMQNNRLGNINQSLILKIKQMVQQSKSEKTVHQKTDHADDQVLEQLNDRIKYLTIKVSNEESNNFALIKKLEDAEHKANQLTEMIGIVTGQSQESEDRANTWRERALMQKEDTEAHSWRQQYLIQSIKKLTEVNKKLTSKMLSNKEDKKSISICDRNPLFSYEVDFFKGIRSMYQDNKISQYRMNMKGKADQLGLQFDNFYIETQYTKVLKSQQINLCQFSFYKPSFYKFLQDLQDTQPPSRNSDLSRAFMQKLRCMMNCKLNEFMTVETTEQYSRFPEFVYAWFDKYDFDTDTNNITVLQLKEDKTALKKFYQELMNVKLDQSWEVITFREFMLEEMGLEELYFYLQCQNMLFRKAGISKELQFLGELNIYVEYPAAKSILDVILSEFDSWNINFLISKMNEKVVNKNGLEYIDSAFFLRCLLEYYKIERVNRFKLIKRIFDDMCSEEGAVLTFNQFLRIFDRFTEIPLETKVRVYRDCFSVGRGTITPEIIFTVCTETKVFLKYLRLKSFYKLPLQIIRNRKQNQPQSWSVQPPLKYLQSLFSSLKGFLGEGSQFWSKVLSLGVHQLSTNVDVFRRYFGLNNRSAPENSVLKCRHFLHWMGEFTARVRQVSFRNLYDILEEADRKNCRFSMEVDEDFVGSIYLQHIQAEINLYTTTNSIIQWKKKVHAFRLNVAAKKIQRQVRAKFIQPYMDIYQILFDRVKKLRNVVTRRR